MKLVNINYDNYLDNLSMLQNFWSDLIVTNFETDIYIDSFEKWIYKFQTLQPSSVIFSVSILQDDDVLVGGYVIEYYPQSKCCILGYLVVSEKYRGRNIAKLLINDILSNNFNYNYLIIECKNPKINSKDIMDPNIRINFYKKLGFNFLDIDYYYPSKITTNEYLLGYIKKNNNVNDELNLICLWLIEYYSNNDIVNNYYLLLMLNEINNKYKLNFNLTEYYNE
jgi:GNAT superfamily N-acetyltransferase